VRVRADVQRGISVSGGSAPSTEIEQHVVRISQALAIEGPWFAQFKQAADGTHRLLEINARVAGSMGTTRLTGVNIPQLAAFIFLGYPVVVPEPLADVFVNRCLSTVGSVDDFDWAIWDLEDTLLRKDRKPDPDAIACLFDLQNRGKRQVLLTRHPNPRALLADYRLPDLFVRIATTSDKIASFSELAREFAIEPRRCVAINDSNTEKLQFQRAFPELRVVTPDAIDVLGRERVS
jgi:hypothetical protein